MACTSKTLTCWEKSSEVGLHCWQSALSTPSDRLSAMYNLSRMTDLTITFHDHEGSLKAHRLILAMSSPVFEAMLFGPMAEEGELKLPEDPPKAFKWMMGYIYCGTSKLPDVTTAVQVYHLSSKYQMNVLQSICCQFLQKKLNASNLPMIYDTASLFDDSELIQKCRQVVGTSANEVFSSSYIGELSLKSMHDLLQQNLHVSSEAVVFKGLLKWAAVQENCDITPETGHILRQVLNELLPHVRFLSLMVDEFVEHIMPSNILTPDEKCAILVNMKGVADVPIPQACSKIRESRLMYNVDEVHNLTIKQGHYVDDSIAAEDVDGLNGDSRRTDGHYWCNRNTDDSADNDLPMFFAEHSRMNMLGSFRDSDYDRRRVNQRASRQRRLPALYGVYDNHGRVSDEDEEEEEEEQKDEEDEIPDNFVVIKEMKVSAIIHLKCITWQTYTPLRKGTALVISDSSGTVMREKAPFLETTRRSHDLMRRSHDLARRYKYIIDFDEHWVMDPNEAYDIYLKGELQSDDYAAFSLQYGQLGIKGEISHDEELALRFWCFEKVTP